MPAVFWSLIYLWGASATWMLTVTLTSAERGLTFASLAALENLVQPLALIAVLGISFAPLRTLDLIAVLDKTAKWTIILLSLNGLLAISSIYFDTWPFVSWFVRTDSTGSSVYTRALSMGRQLGIFNQPFEAGIAYTVGLVACVYLAVGRRSSGWWLWTGLGLIVAGGLLSVSKVFVLGGIPLATVYALWSGGLRRPMRLVRVLIVGGLAALLMVSLGTWTGWSYLGRLFDRSYLAASGVISVYTAGRFGGQDSGVGRLFEEAWSEAPLKGFGLGAHSPLDNGFLEFFYQGGSVALMLYLAILLLIGLSAFRALVHGRAEGKLVAVIWLTVIGGSFGAPVLTINRASIILWVMLCGSMSILVRAPVNSQVWCDPKEAGGA